MTITNTGDEDSMTGAFIESAYTPFKQASYRLDMLQQDFETMLRTGDYFNTAFRTRLVDSANILYAKSKHTGFNDVECRNIEYYLNKLQVSNDQIATILTGFSRMNVIDQSSRRVLNDYVDEFRKYAYDFLDKEGSALQVHGQLYKTKDRLDVIEQLEKIYVVKGAKRFNNKFGVPINLRISLMARIMAMRVMAELDNIFLIEGPNGYGKSSFAWALGSTVAEYLGVPFDVKDVFLFNEANDFVENRIRGLLPKSITIFDEFGNQANRRRSMQLSQIDFMDRLKLIRYKGFTLLGCWTTLNELDAQLQSRIQGVFTITQPGLAQLRIFNLNRYAKDKEFIPFGAKKMVAYTPEESNKIIETYDDLNILTIPFFKIPEQQWNEDYIPLKDMANDTGRIALKSTTVRKRAAELYIEFLATLPPDTVKITSDKLKDFSKEKNFVLDFGAVANLVGNAIGSRRRDIFHQNADPKSKWDGYVDVDSYVESYIKKLKAQYRGAKQAADLKGQGGNAL